MSSRFGLIALMLLWISVLPCWAAVNYSTSALAYPPLNFNAEVQDSHSNGPSSVNTSYVYGFSNGGAGTIIDGQKYSQDFSVQAQGQAHVSVADHVALGVSASATIPAGYPNGWASDAHGQVVDVQSQAAVGESLTVSNPSSQIADFKVATIGVQYHLQGSFLAQARSLSQVEFDINLIVPYLDDSGALQHRQLSSVNFWEPPAGSESGGLDDTFADLNTFPPGDAITTQPWTLSILLRASANVGTPASPGPGSGYMASTQFSDTAFVSGFEFMDANGNSIPGLQIVGSSGINYPDVVPEPSLGALLMAGACLRLRRRR